MDNSGIKMATQKEIAKWLEYLLKQGYDNKIGWNDLYDIIFSNDVSSVIFNRFPDFHYNNMDCGYENNVEFFIDDFLYYAGLYDKKYPSIMDFNTFNE